MNDRNESSTSKPEAIASTPARAAGDTAAVKAIFFLDGQGLVQSWNEVAQDVTGYRAEEIVGRHVSVLYAPEQIESGRPEQDLSDTLERGRLQEQVWWQRKDGPRFPARVQLVAQRTGPRDLLGFACCVQQAAADHAAAEIDGDANRWHELADAIEDYAILMLDPGGRIIDWNRGAESQLQYRADEVFGQHYSLFHAHEIIEPGEPIERLEEAARNGSIRYETWRLRNDNSRFRASVALIARYDANGQLTGFFDIARDIDGRKLQEDAEQTSRRMNDFLALLAHELRNPLAPIRNAVTIMQLESVENLVVLRCRDMIDRQVRHLTRLVDDLLDIGRVTTGKIPLQKEVLKLSAVIARGIEAVRSVVDSRRHTLQVALPDEEVWLHGDALRLAQVFQNLLHNAAKFTPDAGLIRVEAGLERGWVVIRIRDNGRGIAPDSLRDIFELFVQDGGQSNASDNSLGVGLALVRSIVELHGGDVSAQSEGLGAGSCFVVRLPRYRRIDAEVAPGERNDGIEPTPSTEKRILVVDDNKDSADSMAMLIEIMGFKVRAAYTGAEALRCVSAQPPDIVLLDIGMPAMDGYEVASKLRDMPRGESFKIIAMTGFGQSSDREKALATGFDAHLVKPVKNDELQKILGSLQ